MRRRAATIIVATMTGTVLALWLVLRFFWMAQLQSDEALSVRKDLGHAAAMLGHTLSTMEALAKDWALRDATYEHMASRAPGFVRDNLMADFWEEQKLDIVVLSDRRGRIVSGNAYDHETRRLYPIPPELRAELRPGSALVATQDEVVVVKGILMLPQGALMVASCPILPSRRVGKSRGHLVLGRYLDGSALQELRDLSGLVLTLQPFSEVPRLVTGDTSLEQLRSGLSVVQPMGLTRVVGFAPLRDIQGKPALLLGVDDPRSVYRSGLATMGYTLLAFLFVGGVLALTMARIIERMVLARLARLIEEVDRIGAAASPGDRVTVAGHDELTSLAVAVNTMLGALEQSRQELAAGEKRFRDIALNISDWLWEVDAKGRHTFCSERVTQVLGFAPDTLLGRPLTALVSSEQAGQVIFKLAGAMSRQVPIEDVEFWALGGDGRHVYIQLNAVPITGASGEFIGYRGVGQDITARHHAEETQRLVAVGELAGGVAHEFNNILTAMSMSAEFALISPDPERAASLVENVLAGTSRGAGICRNLLRFARPEEPRRELVLISDPITAAVSMAAREVANAGLTARVSEVGEPRPVRGDAGQLAQAFLNLIINACQSSPEGGEVAIATLYESGGGDSGSVTVEVSDTGKGIRPEHISRIFEPFFTTHGSGELGPRRGTGLGLAVVHSIVGAHGGSINVRSREGVGTTFSLRFRTEVGTPVSSAGSEAQVFAPTLDPRHAGRSVLVADDEAGIRDMLAEALRQCGYVVTRASSADEAIAALAAAPDVIVTDLLMPGGGGEAVLQAAKDLSTSPRVIIMTGRGEPDVIEGLHRLGAFAVIAKPFNISQVVEAARAALEAGPDLPPDARETPTA